MSVLVDLSKVPAPDVIENITFEDILVRRKEQFIEQYTTEEQKDHWRQVLTLESDPVVKLLEENAYNELLLRQRINEAAHAVMLAYAMGSDLDQLAANFQVTRKLIQEADPNANPPIMAIYESDEELRLRTQMAFEGLSVAGPRAAYEFHALSAHPKVLDVSAISPQPAYVIVTVLGRDGKGDAPQAVINAVEKALNDDTVRPLADRLTVKSAKVIDYELNAQLFIYPTPEIEPILIEARRRADLFIKNSHKLGRDITISAIHAALHVEGVQRVEVIKPVKNIIIDKTQAAYCIKVTISIGGSDE